MTDNRTTELLCKLLEEHGIAWKKRRGYIRWSKQTKYGVTHYQAWPCLDGTITLTVRDEYGLTPEQAIAATLGWIDEPDTIRNELADGGLIADALAPVCVDEKERRAFERGRVHERFAQQIFKEATS